MFYFRKTPTWLKSLFPRAVWDIDTTQKRLFLTFDDGPIPQLTPWVLSVLTEFGAKATFFYVGDNIRKYPKLAERAVMEGHTIGNHTYNHLKGWRTSVDDYLQNIETCERLIENHTGMASKRLFRPPYGQLTFAQAKAVTAQYRLVMWDYLTGDFDPAVTPERCLSGALAGVRKGSIVTYHENVKADANIRYSLPKFLDYFSNRGFQFCAID